jgi:integrase
MIKTAIIFDHRGRTAKGKEGPLEVRVTVDRKSYYINTGVRVRACEWKYERVVNRGDADELTERVQVLERRVMEEVNHCIDRMVPIDVAVIRKKIWGVAVDNDGGAATFLDWFDGQIALLPVSDGRRKHYRTTLARLRACNIIRCWEDLTAENLYRWDAWLHGQKKPLTDSERLAKKVAEPIGQGTIYNQHKNLKHMLWRAVEMGYIKSNPYQQLRGKILRGARENVDYLTEDEVAKILAFEPVDAITRTAKDLFTIQVYTGLSYSDMQRFDASAYKLVDGRWVSVGERVKTGVSYVSQLLPPVVKVMEKYGWHVPQLSNQKYNQALKAIGVACGITTPMHSHLARHTFATWMLRNGAKVENVKAMLGHKKIEQTMRYAKVVAASVHEDFDRVAERMMKPAADSTGTVETSGMKRE